MLAQALADPDEEVRINALLALAGLGRAVRAHQSTLSARRGDPSPRVREAAGRALNQLRAVWSEMPETSDLLREGPLTPAATAALVEAAANGEAEPLARTLGKYEQTDILVTAYLSQGGSSHLPGVLIALRKLPEQEYTRIASILAAAWNGHASLAPLLAQLKSLETEARLMAVEIAGRMGTEEAIAALIQVLQPRCSRILRAQPQNKH
jgi:HEAT repeat protein